MAFETGKNNETQQREEVAREEKRSRRAKRREQREEEFDEEEEHQSRGSFMRSRAISIRGASGRPALFDKRYRELTKDDADERSVLLVPNGSVDGKRLANDRGFLIYATQINGSVYWHPIIIESSDNPVRVEAVKGRHRETSDGLELNNYTTTYDGIDKKFVERMEQYVQDEVACDGDYIFTNVTVVPTSVDIDDKDNVRIITYLAEDANVTVANGDDPYSAANIGKKTKIKGLAKFNQDRIKQDLLGNPYRADWTIELSEIDKDGGKEILFENESDRLLVTLDGFVTASYVGPDMYPEEVDDGRRYKPNCFVPEIAVTNINTYHDVEDGQFDRGILGIVALPFMNTDDYWTRQFEQTFNSFDDARKLSGFIYGMVWENDIIPDDIEDIDEDADEHAKWIRKIFVEGEADVCLMIKEGGVDFTMGKLFLAIGEGSNNALERLITSLNTISDDAFADICDEENYSWSCGDVVTSVVRIPHGYFKDKNGNKVPSEMVDTLYMLNVIKANQPDLIDDWYATTGCDTSMDESEAFTRLIRIYQQVTGNTFVHTGNVTKCYLGGKFTKIAYQAVEEGPLAISIESDTNGQTIRRRRRGLRSDRRDGLESNLVKSRRGRSGRSGRGRRRFTSTSYR